MRDWPFQKISHSVQQHELRKSWEEALSGLRPEFSSGALQFQRQAPVSKSNDQCPPTQQCREINHPCQDLLPSLVCRIVLDSDGLDLFGAANFDFAFAHWIKV